MVEQEAYFVHTQYRKQETHFINNMTGLASCIVSLFVVFVSTERPLTQEDTRQARHEVAFDPFSKDHSDLYIVIAKTRQKKAKNECLIDEDVFDIFDNIDKAKEQMARIAKNIKISNHIGVKDTVGVRMVKLPNNGDSK